MSETVVVPEGGLQAAMRYVKNDPQYRAEVKASLLEFIRWQRESGPRPTVTECQHLADFQASVFEKMTTEKRARELLLENENGTILNYPKYIVEE